MLVQSVVYTIQILGILPPYTMYENSWKHYVHTDIYIYPWLLSWKVKNILPNSSKCNQFVRITPSSHLLVYGHSVPIFRDDHQYFINGVVIFWLPEAIVDEHAFSLVSNKSFFEKYILTSIPGNYFSIKGNEVLNLGIIVDLDWEIAHWNELAFLISSLRFDVTDLSEKLFFIILVFENENRAFAQSKNKKVSFRRYNF